MGLWVNSHHRVSLRPPGYHQLQTYDGRHKNSWGSPKKVMRIYHYIDAIMTTIGSQITSLTVVFSTVYSDVDQRKHQSSASLAFVCGIHRDRWIPRTKGQLRGKCFHLMTSSCKHRLLGMLPHVFHYSNVIMSAIASQIIGVSIVCSTDGSSADLKKHQTSSSQAFRGTKASNAEMFQWILIAMAYQLFEFYIDVLQG